MGLDGFSMGNLGLNADMTSAQMANQAEQIARKESMVKIKDVTEAAEDGGVKRKEEDEPDKNEFYDGFKKDEDEEDEEENSDANKDSRTLLKDGDFEIKDPKELSVRINSNTEQVELFNKKNERIIETISAKDLMEVVSKLDGSSGILVNRKI